MYRNGGEEKTPFTHLLTAIGASGMGDLKECQGGEENTCEIVIR
jgi:hypothetical protein